MSKTILIAGGSGLVGQALTALLEQRQYRVRILSTQKDKCDQQKFFYWNPQSGDIDKQALLQADYIVNLAGETIVGKWSTAKKERISKSRIQAVQLINKTLSDTSHQVQAICHASATGFYGSQAANWLDENSPKGEGFLAETCDEWEKAQKELKDIRCIQLRIGMVLSAQGGALAKMLPTFRLGLGLPLGNGKQYMPWIHIDDLCQMILFTLERKSIQGTYNAVAPHPVTNTEFTGLLNRQVKKVFFMMRVPAFVLRIGMGESADLLLHSQRVSSEKIRATGFLFNYDTFF